MIEKYEQFVLNNADIVNRLEGVLKSLALIIPGRFNDSIIVSEICTFNVVIDHRSAVGCQDYPMVQ